MIEQIEKFTSTPEELKILYNCECLLVVYGHTLDDNSLYHNIIEDYDYCWKLRGRYDEQPKIANNGNDSRYFHGYIFSINKAHLLADDRNLILFRLDSGRKIEKYDIKKYKENKQAQLINSLFEGL